MEDNATSGSDFTDFKYWAFISYSHRDKAWGDWLHKALETYRVPTRLAGTPGRDGTVPKRIFPVFRDREELPTSADLGGAIRTALEQSLTLIVICSPEAANSIWVNEEIKIFKAMGRENRVICLIVDGEPNASNKSGSELRECFPEVLRYKVDANGTITDERTESIAADLREDKDGKINAKLKLIAGIIGVGFDDLKQRERSRRRMRRIQAFAASIVVLAGLSGVWYWGDQKAQQEAWEQSRQESLRLAVLANEQVEAGDPVTGILLALEGLPKNLEEPKRPIVHEIHQSLLRAHLARRDFAVFRHEKGITHTAFSPDGNKVLTTSQDKTARLWDAENGRLVAVLKGHQSFVNNAVFSPDGNHIVTASRDGTARVWNAENGQQTAVLQHMGSVNHAAFSPDSLLVATASSDKTARLWDVKSGQEIAVMQEGFLNVKSVSFSQNGRRVVISTGQTATVWNVENGQQITEMWGHEKTINHAAFSPDGRQLVTASRDNTVRLWDMETGLQESILTSHEDIVVHAEFSPDGKRLATASSDKTARIWDSANGREIAVLRGMINPSLTSHSARMADV